MVDTNSLRLFVLAAERLNISAAGRELGWAPAVASSRLAKLERTLDAELLHRSTRKVSLSLEGEAFLPFAREILAQEDFAYEALGRGTAQPTGTVRFAASSSFAQLYIVPIISEFLIRFPRLNLDLKLSDTRFDLIEGSFDLALRNHILEDSSLRARKLARDFRVLCASPDYLAKHGTPHTPGDLGDHQLIGFQNDSQHRLVNHVGEVGTFNPNQSKCRLIVDDGLSQKLATMTGVGISNNSLWSVHRELERGDLVRVLPEYVVEDKTDLWLVFPKTNVLSAKTRVLIDFLVEKIGENPPWE